MVYITIPANTFVVSFLMMRNEDTSYDNLSINNCTISLCADLQFVVPSGIQMIHDKIRITLLDPAVPAPVPAPVPAALPAEAPAALPAAQANVNNVIRGENIWKVTIPVGSMIGSKSNYFIPSVLPTTFDVVIISGTQVRISAGQRICQNNMVSVLENDIMCMVI